MALSQRCSAPPPSYGAAESTEYSGPFMSESMTTRAIGFSTPPPLYSPSGALTTCRWPRSSGPPISAMHLPSAITSGAGPMFSMGFWSGTCLSLLLTGAALLEQVRCGSPDDRLAATAVIVRPLADFARRGWRERAYLRIGSELSGMLDRMTPEIRSLMRETAGYEAWELLRQRCPEVPDDLWRIRCELCIVFVARAVADWARLLDESATKQGALPDERFVDNLIAMVLGAMTAIRPTS